MAMGVYHDKERMEVLTADVSGDEPDLMSLAKVASYL